MKHQMRYQTQFTGKWEWVPTVNENDGPSPRCGHTLTVHGKQLDHLKFITQSHKSKINRDLNQNHNHNHNDDGNIDNHRNHNEHESNSHDSHFLGKTHGKLLVSFGESSLLSSREYLDDIYLLDLASLKWAKILGQNVLDEYKPYLRSNFNPVARADHAAVSFGNNLDRCLIFGGKCKDTYLDDLIVIRNICNFPINDIEQEIIEHYHYENRNHKKSKPDDHQLYTDTPLKIESIHLPKGPCGRRGSSLTTWKQGSFLLFGGQRGSIFFNDLWGLDLHKQGWVELATRRNPLERAFHSAFVDSQQQMLLLGGVRDTQANPAPPDIFKLDLRAGKFFKLGDKDTVPGISNALSKGHHSSHFLTKNCDLVIFSPQKASTYILGGNVQSEHCGRCTQVVQPETNSNSPYGSCRPATALLQSQHTLNEFKSIGCNNRPLERLFVLGGYNPSKRICTNKLYSLKFSAEACMIANHKCNFKQTMIIPKVLKTKDEENQNNHDNQMNSNNNSNHDNRLCNVTPMRVTRRSRLNTIQQKQIQQIPPQQSSIPDKIQQQQQQQQQQHPLEQQTFSRKRRIKSKKVKIIQTPVRAKPSLSTTVSFRMFESSAANQKINGLDPSLIANQRYMGKNEEQQQQQRQQQQPREEIKEIINFEQKPIHLEYIERILLHFDESLLDPESAFILEPHEVIEIIYNVLPLIEQDSTLTRITGPVKVFGDIHGQLGDLMSLFKSFGFPDRNIGDIGYYKYIFLGDFVDRGQKSLEVICLLFALKIEYPNRIFLIRGNHECHAMNEMYGFYHEINERLYPNIDTLKYLDNSILNENISPQFNDELNQYFARVELKRQKQLQQSSSIMNTDQFLELDLEFETIEISDHDTHDDHDHEDHDEHSEESRPKTPKLMKKYKTRKLFRDRNDCISYVVQSFEYTFQWLPLGILVNNKILCVHGGIGQIETIEEIEEIERPCDVVCDVQQEMSVQQKKVVDLLWSDPAEKDTEMGFQPNKRGVSCVFGSDIVHKFCKTNKIDLIVRGHQVVKDGFEYFAGGHLITLFSATNYCNVMDNAGAILCVDNNLRVLPKLVEARPLNMNHHHHHYNNNNTNNNDDDDDGLHDHEHDHEDEEDDEDESADNLPWRKLKQFPPSPMRNSGNQQIIDFDISDDDEEDDNNNVHQNISQSIHLTFDDNNSNINNDSDNPDGHPQEPEIGDQTYFNNSIEQTIVTFK